MMSENRNIIGNEVAEPKQQKKRQSAEDKLKALLDEHYLRIEKMVNEKLDAKLEHMQYRIYKSFMIELNRAILRR
ncbi:hypothetical protein [Desulfitobacterium sp. PCE1]|uniref:hypothetical protein n=1 Tax=Desulfitobacterium sp. PCE1 TaxID=146907 RepID=UPI0003A27DE9|nr:hypothetical protein [Desulfitobacterium sp. PCE1]